MPPPWFKPGEEVGYLCNNISNQFKKKKKKKRMSISKFLNKDKEFFGTSLLIENF